MSTPILATKLYVPPHQPKVVLRSRLIERLNEGLDHRLTLISAPAGFGKSTLLSEWLAGSDRPAAWLSLEEGDNDPTRFLAYLVAALRTIEARYRRKGIEYAQVRSPATHCPGTLEPRNQRAAFPRHHYRQRAQPEHLSQAPGSEAH